MTTTTDIVNQALQQIGTRTSVTDAELLNQTSNEAIQANISLISTRDQLLRMAPWACAFNYDNLVYITSQPGTPENTSAGTTTWTKGTPAPPWAYEYQYPVDCLKACFIIPAFTTGFAGSTPITTAVTGGSPANWQGPPVLFKVSIDQFYGATAVAIVAAGLGYAVQDIITLAAPASGLGAPAKIRVLTVSGPGAVLTCEVVTSVINGTIAGSYFAKPTGTQAQASTTGSGTGFTCTLTIQAAQASQRVILTNQEYATLAFIKQVTDPNIMDPLFIDAWASILGARLAMALTGDKTLANMSIQDANQSITEARKADANEGLIINNVTPDWIRIRGIDFSGDVAWGGPNSFDWGNLFSLYA